MAMDLTCNGRLTVSPFVTERKVLKMAEMLEGIKFGGYAAQRASTDLAETLSTSDAPHSFAHLINIRNLPLYDEAPVEWNRIASTETVNDFRPTTFYTLKANFESLKHGKGTGGQVIAPEVAELDTYSKGIGYREEEVQAAVKKRGFLWGISLERVVNDPARAFRQVPQDMLQVGIKTDEFVVFQALVDGATAASQMTGGEDRITEETVPANAPLSPSAIRVALRNISERTDADGNKIPLASSYELVVPLGEKDDVEWMIQQAGNIIRVQDGNFTYGNPGTGGLNRVSGVIESEFIPEGSWYLVPAAGSTLRPSLVRLQLAGYTSPEVYVKGTPTPVLGGASSDPFQAFSWDTDEAAYKYRHFTNSALITQEQLVWSDGSGA